MRVAQGFRGFPELLADRAERHPGRQAVLEISPGEDRAVRAESTYAGLLQDAQGVAAALSARYPAGSRILIVHESGVSFATAFLGCLLAGLVAVPAPSPAGYRRQQSRLAGIVRHSGAHAVLCDASHRPDVADWLADNGLAGTDLLVPESFPASGDRVPASVSAARAEDPAYLQYTSGSTGRPKGVIITHRNLMSNVAHFAACVDAGEGTRCGGWLPMYHDFGLIAHLAVPLFLGGTSVLMAPSVFLRHPVRWLTAVDRYDLHLSGGPDFAYDLCLRKITDEQIAALDLSRWRHAVNGSEPIRASVLAAFTDRFAAAGFRPEAMSPGYGLAETTLAATLSPRGERPVVTQVDAGALARHRFVPLTGTAAGDAGAVRRVVASGFWSSERGVVVDPHTAAVVPDGHVGEIWVRGASVSPGYWNDPEATAGVFDAVTADGTGGFLRTGDLGSVWDGQLYVTGRIKEMLIAHGRKLYPQDIEDVVRTAHPSLAAGVGAAFRLEESGPETPDEIAVVQECRGGLIGSEGAEAVAGAVRRRVREEFAVALAAVVLVRPGTVERTTSGKIQRGAMARALRDGTLRGVVLDSRTGTASGMPSAASGPALDAAPAAGTTA
ncbi:fatty acyl-AMP ligase [Streptomyces sp. NBC_00525]|uniref:fatty acyl-AMP ligase n=1 Tax=Streptomyces sp. NBC_00525 TaxID=2903660 RepID=UPI002E7FE8F1|nr:fatty acyl-AMP ligase [Streptomyces sp. NBC_00525]WUC96312.1 fatty acyl-AMP ligase [Streptomyces sp. NBC_00525]